MRYITVKENGKEKEYLGIRGWTLMFVLPGLISIGHAIGYTKAKHEYSQRFIPEPVPAKERIPRIIEVQKGFMPPIDIEITCEDLDKSDGHGLPETYLNLIRQGEKYSLIRGLDGKLQIKNIREE